MQDDRQPGATAETDPCADPWTEAREAHRHPRTVARRLAHSRRGLWLIGVMSFLESIIVPIPLEVVLIPYMMARRDILWRIAAVVLLGCVIGALLGYGVGYFVFDTLGVRLVEWAGWQEQFDTTRTWFEKHGFLAVLAIGVTPVPFQVAMLVAGVMKYPVYLFVAAALIARGIRYFGLALLVHVFGDRAMEMWNRHKKSTVATITAVLVVAIVLNVWVF
ncbi:YqaA family protein [Caenispirillum salinarum]|uniref:YqaA family protein n=1 Tax=Caenispirillum salinarum TaxID=859058 RepID=UPI0038502E8B